MSWKDVKAERFDFVSTAEWSIFFGKERVEEEVERKKKKKKTADSQFVFGVPLKGADSILYHQELSG
jgi:hypothetical protein